MALSGGTHGSMLSALYSVPVSDVGRAFGNQRDHARSVFSLKSLSYMTRDSFVMAPPASLFLQANEPSSSETGEDDTVASSHDHIGVRFLYKSPSFNFFYLLLTAQSSMAVSSWA